MQQLYELFLKNGLRPLSVFPDVSQFELTSSDISALMLLKIHGHLTMSELAEYLGAPLSTATSIAKRLVRKGYIFREKSVTDQRIIMNHLTDDGESTAQEALKSMEKMFTRIQEALSPDELQLFIHLALKVAKSLQHQPASNLVKPSGIIQIPID